MQTTQILLIEDNPGDVRLIQELLKEDSRFTYETHSVKRLVEGMDYHAKHKPDIILLDLSLPDSQGFDTFTKLNASAPNTPIVILTGLIDDALAIIAVQAGAQDYLIKGQVNGDMLTRTIRYSIQRKQVEKQLRESEQRNNHIIEGTQVGTWEWNVQTGETVFNQRWAEIIGHSLEELAPISIKTLNNLAHPDDLKQSAELLKKHFQGSLNLYDCEIRMRHKNGTWVWVQDRGRVITRTADGSRC
jgi:two-component system sensor histidine kinase UhpB